MSSSWVGGGAANRKKEDRKRERERVRGPDFEPVGGRPEWLEPSPLATLVTDSPHDKTSIVVHK